MRLFPLTTNERAEMGATHVIEITADDLTQTATNTAQTITTDLKIGIGDICLRIGSVLKVPFKDASDAAFNTDTMSVGDTVGGVASLAVAIEVNENGTEILDSNLPSVKTTVFTAASAVTITFNSQSAKLLNNIDVGVIYILVTLFRPHLLSNAISYGPIQTK